MYTLIDGIPTLLQMYGTKPILQTGKHGKIATVMAPSKYPVTNDLLLVVIYLYPIPYPQLTLFYHYPIPLKNTQINVVLPLPDTSYK